MQPTHDFELTNRVRHKKQREYTGVVIAIYDNNPRRGHYRKWYLDVAMDDAEMQVYYKTPVENWEKIGGDEE